MAPNGRPRAGSGHSIRADGGAVPSDRVLVLNPVSGSGDHVTEVRSRAADHGFEVRETEGEGDAVRFAREASREGASIVAAAGGDGTINEVVRGVYEADALDDVAIAVVPGGTGNNFAGNVGIDTVADAFAVIERGERRRLDLGLGNGRPFVNSCVAGLTADASAETDDEVKSRLGVLAYVLATLRTLSDFDGLRLAVETEGAIRGSGVDEGRESAATDADEDGATGGWSGASGGAKRASDNESGIAADAGNDEEWRGEAMLVLIGNARCFPGVGNRSQANVEDGLQEVTIVEQSPGSSLLDSAAVGELLGDDTRLLGEGGRLFDGVDAPITRLRAPSLSIRALDGEVRFSLDGEIVETDAFDVDTLPRALECFVGEAYDPDPGE